VTEMIAEEIVSLPMFPQMTSRQQLCVIKELVNFCGRTVSQKLAAAGSVEPAVTERIA